MERAVSWIINIELAVALAAALALVGASFAGFKPFVVLSGSMEPAVRVGSLAYVDSRADPALMQAGDIVTFKAGDGAVVTHRVVQVDRAGEVLLTKGDANLQADPAPVPFGQVVGRMVLSVPFAGALADAFVAAKAAWIAALVLFNAVLLILPRWASRRRRKRIWAE